MVTLIENNSQRDFLRKNPVMVIAAILLVPDYYIRAYYKVNDLFWRFFMEIFMISVLSLFAVLGAVTICKELIYGSLKPREITIYALNNENSIEYLLRSLKNQYPETVIKIKDGGSEDKTLEIAKKLGVEVNDSYS